MTGSAFAPDRILVGGRIHAVAADDTVVSAVAIKNGRFVAVGGYQDVRALAGPGTEAADLDGATVVPGLIDAHNHLVPYCTPVPAAVPVS